MIWWECFMVLSPHGWFAVGGVFLKQLRAVSLFLWWQVEKRKIDFFDKQYIDYLSWGQFQWKDAIYGKKHS